MDAMEILKMINEGESHYIEFKKIHKRNHKGRV